MQMEKIELRSLEAVYISRLLEKINKTNIIIENNKIAIKPKSKKI